MGTVEDMNFRRANPRIDDAERRKNVTDAIEVIHNGNAVNGDPVLRVLRNSNAPTVVCDPYFYFRFRVKLAEYPERFLKTLRQDGIRYLLYVGRGRTAQVRDRGFQGPVLTSPSHP